jgi:hypothetical protein
MLNRVSITALSVILTIFSNVKILNAQNRTWLNYEVGVSNNSQNWNTQLNNLYFQKSSHSIVGGYIEQEINNFLSVELGVNDKFYGFDAFYIENDTVKNNLGSYAQCIQIPLRLRTRINLLNNKLFLSPHVGAGLLIKSYGGVESFFEGEDFDIEVKTKFPKTAFLIETGLSIELILKSWKFAFLATGNYSGKEFINYSVKEKNTYFSTNGNYITFQIRVGYAISNFWSREFWNSKK